VSQGQLARGKEEVYGYEYWEFMEKANSWYLYHVPDLLGRKNWPDMPQIKWRGYLHERKDNANHKIQES
jgi:hypothetical protein